MKNIPNTYGRWFPRTPAQCILEGPESSKTCRNYAVKKLLVSRLYDDLVDELRTRLYTGRIRGGRTGASKRVFKNIEYWFKRMSCYNRYKQWNVEITRSGTDRYGSPYMSLVAEYHGDRCYIQVFSVIDTTLVAGRFTRFVAKWLPWFHSYLNDKFDIYSMTKLRIYIYPDAYIDMPVYSFKITQGIMEKYDPTEKWEKEGNRATRVNYFRPEYKVSGS